MCRKFLSIFVTFSLICFLFVSCKSDNSFTSSRGSSAIDQQITTTDRLFQIVNPECKEVGVINSESTSLLTYRCPNKDGMIYTPKWNEENTEETISSLCQKVNDSGASIAFVGYSSALDYIRLPLEVLVCFPETGTSFKGTAISVNASPTDTDSKISQIVDKECSEVGTLDLDSIPAFSYKCPSKDGIIYTPRWSASDTGDDISAQCEKLTEKGATVAFIGVSSSQDSIRLPLEVLVCHPKQGTAFKGTITQINPASL